MPEIYDVVIIGGGPAGLSAGLYGSRARLDTLIIEKSKYGGQTATTSELENYPGSFAERKNERTSIRLWSQICKR